MGPRKHSQILYQEWMYRPIGCVETAQISLLFCLCTFCGNKTCQPWKWLIVLSGTCPVVTTSFTYWYTTVRYG